MNTLKRLFLLFLLLGIFYPAFFLPISPALEPPSTEAYGRACLGVEEFSSPEDETAMKTVVFDKNSKSGPGKRLVLYADSTIESVLLAVAFDSRTRELANDWKPQLIEMKAWEEQRLPVAPVIWSWSEGSEPFEIYVVFLKKTSEGLEELETLIQAMQHSETEPQLLNLQTQRLREIIQGWTANQDLTRFHAGQTPAGWGGTLRGAGFPWRQTAEKAVFGTNGRSFLIYRSGD